MPDSSASRMLQTLQNSAQPTSQQILQSVPSAVDPTLSTVQPVSDTVPSFSSEISDQQKLATFEEILSEMEAEKQNMVPLTPDPLVEAPTEVPLEAPPIQPVVEPVAPTAPAVSSPPDQPQSFASVSRKEQEIGSTVASAELPGGMQYVESEPNPEIPEEVESFLQKVEEQKAQLPQEIVAAAQEHAAQTTQRQLPQDVKVLPISASEAEAAKKKNATFSIKWLLVFSQKLVQVFKGRAVYRPE